MQDQMRINYRGLIAEKMQSGNIRYRVRVDGQPNQKIRLHISPEHRDFREHYNSARAGIELPAPADLPAKRKHKSRVKYLEGTISWLTELHESYLAKEVETGTKSPLTLKEKQKLYRRLRRRCGEYAVGIPASEVLKIRDDMMSTPAYADKMIQTIRVLYDWGMERGYCADNPAKALKTIDRGKGGTVPWTLDDVSKYLNHHPLGSLPHTTLCLLLCTGCRIGDAIQLGRGHEKQIDGTTHICWQPSKRGSAFSQVPLLPMLEKATRASTVQGPTYLLTVRGRSFSSPDNLGNQFRSWAREAGIEKSAHGVRKSVGNILAELGFSQYHVMAVLSHTEAKTSEIYTKDVNRRQLAKEAMENMGMLLEKL